MRRLLAIGLAAASCLFAAGAAAQGTDGAARAMIARYVGTWEVDALLAEPAVSGELRALLGPHWQHFSTNIGTNGGIEFFGGALAVAGNAPHQGTEEEAIVCIRPWGARPAVHAAIYSKAAVTVFTRASQYLDLPTCVKDWVTLVSSRHAARLDQPAQVRLRRPAG